MSNHSSGERSVDVANAKEADSTHQVLRAIFLHTSRAPGGQRDHSGEGGGGREGGGLFCPIVILSDGVGHFDAQHVPASI